LLVCGSHHIDNLMAWLMALIWNYDALLYLLICNSCLISLDDNI
jgi:hypothetical protein